MISDLLLAHPRVRDLTGKIFGQLTVISFVGIGPSGDARWKCLCSCGNESIVYALTLKAKRPVKSCGCICLKSGSESPSFKHGGSYSRLYYILEGMKNRCFNKNYHGFKYWGGKGVSVCPAWMDFENFRAWAFANGYKSNLTIDRIDSNGNYDPSNCQWITMAENTRKAAKHRMANKKGEIVA